jgi:hypothetical protein
MERPVVAEVANDVFSGGLMFYVVQVMTAGIRGPRRKRHRRTVGDPFKTPPVRPFNPLIKVMNLAVLLAAGSVVSAVDDGNIALRVVIVVLGVLLLGVAFYYLAHPWGGRVGDDASEPAERVGITA